MRRLVREANGLVGDGVDGSFEDVAFPLEHGTDAMPSL
jgi:hypothetical protein